MKFRFSGVLVIALALAACMASAQDAGAPQQGGGWRQGRGRGAGFMGRGVAGTVAAIGSDSLTVKTDRGETYTVHFSANTRFLKQPPRPANAENNDNQPGAADTRGGGNGGRDGFDGQGGRRMRFSPPVPIQLSDIHVGDAVMAGGEVDTSAKSVGAVMIMQLDPERAKEMREMEANFGKTWLMGRVTAINETTVTLDSDIDHATHSFVADENTDFRKRRDPITLADIHAGDMVRVEGAVKDGTFVAKSVAVMGGMRPQGPPPQQ